MVIQFPCASCNKPCKSNQLSIYCDLCETWVHLKCTTLSYNDFVSIGTSNEPYYCSNCCCAIFPLPALDNDEMLAVTCNTKIDISQSTSYINCDARTNQYCSVNSLSSMYGNSNDFMFFHANVRSLVKNFEKLEELLHELKKLPNAIVVTETKLNDSSPDIALPGNNITQLNSKTRAGGVGVFIKSDYIFTLEKS